MSLGVFSAGSSCFLWAWWCVVVDVPSFAEDGVAAADRLDTLPDGVPMFTLGWEALAFAAKYLRHPDGERQGERWVFTPRQTRFILWYYAVDDNGDWLFGHAARRLSKGPIVHSERVFTPDGWRRHGDLRVGDRVFAVDGSVSRVAGLGPEVTEDCYRVVFSDGTSVRCTGSHRWPVDVFRGGGKRRREVLTVAEMLEMGLVYDRKLTSGKTKATNGGVGRFRTVESPIVDGSHADLPIDPYLFGYWLGDGDSDGFRITVGDADLEPFLSRCASVGVHPRVGYHTRGGEPISTARITFPDTGFRAALVRLGVLGAKGIPSEYMASSALQRIELLRGIVDSDGTVDKNGRVEVSLKEGPLATDVVDLCRSLGLMPKVAVNRSSYRGKYCGNRVCIAFTSPYFNPASLPRKAERAELKRSHKQLFSRSRMIVGVEPVESEPARCITITHDSHQYLVGEGLVPTCNSGKSPWAAVMAVIELLAPVRFSHFDTGVRGGCIGKPVALPWVQIAAATAEQTKNVMMYIRSLLSPALAPELHRDFKLDVGKEKVFVEPSGTLEVITSSAASAEGSRATFIIADELEHWLPSNGGIDLFRTLKANLTKTGSRMVETLNSWVPDAGSAGEETFKSWCEIEDGVARRPKMGILYDAVQAPPGVELSDEVALREALEFVYADCPWSLKQLDSIVSDIYTSRDASEARRKYLNQNVAPDSAWVDPQLWASMADRERVVSPDEEIVLFFDGSISHDATALAGCCLDDGHVVSFGVWEPSLSKNDGRPDRVDVRLVDERVDWVMNNYNVVAFFADVREWEGFVHHVWPERYRDRLQVWASPRGDLPAPIAWDMRGKVREFTLAAELTEADILQRRFTNDGDRLMANHVRNARRYENRWGSSVCKETKKSPKKIDACVAMIGARHVYRLVKESDRSSMTYEAFFA